MDMTRIDTAIVDGSFYTDPTLLAAISKFAQQKGAAVHFHWACCRMVACHSHSRHFVCVAAVVCDA